ncbi:MAG: phosphatidylserine/phosphatidylglycerophosphate/cardiolipin synthase family protein [Eubacteriales bacterium]|nr:phosphatidylserine/phosphatidylglycerophosphate/cardiolipin synthase family protein [Eubacteriales bacterium]
MVVKNRKPKKPSVGRWIRRGVLLLALAYALAALLPYMLVPTQAELPEHWTDAVSSESYVNRATLLETGEEAMETRLRLVANAQSEICVASYIYADDESGRAISAALLDAADRGVKVRILIDGLIGAVNLKNSPLAYALGAHPNVELRFYNPVNLLKPEGLNARFHEKYFIIDGQWLVMGGRNVSDEFLTSSGDPHYNYDLDVLLWKAVPDSYDAVRQVTEYYDRLWPQCAAQFAIIPEAKKQAVAEETEALAQRMGELAEVYDLTVLAPDSLIPVEKTLFLVNPVTAGAKEPLLWKQLCSLMGGAKERLWVLTPYLVMNSVMREDLAALSTPADTRLLLNAHTTGNNIIASADDVIHRGMTQRLLFPLYEFHGDSSMHTKTIAIDHDLSVIGSFNFDIRSAYIDTETMMAIYSPALNDLLAAYMSQRFDESLPSGGSEPVNPAPVEPQAGSLWKSLGIYLLSPFVSLVRFLV